MVSSREEVDRFHRDFLQRRHVPVLHGGPNEHPEYHKGYYAVYFEDPDRIKLEVTHIPLRPPTRRAAGVI